MRECVSCRRCFNDTAGACPFDGRPTVQTLAGEPLIDRYRLERRLGHGGMGIVYDARHVHLRTRRAIKVILPDPHADEEKLARHVRRFLREARALAAIEHPNVVNVIDYGLTHESVPFLVMEFIEGVSLEKMLEGAKVLAPAQALDILRAVAAGVGAAHARGIVHRDLKPANIMLAGKGPAAEAVKVLDFGLAKVWSGDVLGSLTLEQSTGVAGTPLYLAPEQCLEQEANERTDVYALGVVAYQMLTGRLPFNAATAMAVMKLHVEADPPPMSSRAVAVAPPVEMVVRRALSKDPNERHPSAQAFVDELAAAVSQEQAAQQADTLQPDVKAPAPAPAPDIPTPPPSPPAAPPASPTKLRSWLSEFARGSALKFILFAALIASALPLYFSDLISAPPPTNNNLAPTPAPAWRVKQVLTGHTDSVDGVAFSPDGKTLYAGSFDVKVTAWDAQTGQLLKPLEAAAGARQLLAVAVSADGSRVFGATDKGVAVWEARTGRYQTLLTDHGDRVHSLAASSSGTVLASAGKDGTVILWDTQTLAKQRTLRHGANVRAVAIDRSVTYMSSAGDDKKIILWLSDRNFEAGRLIRHAGAVNALAYSTQDSALASADDTGAIILWDWMRKNVVRVLTGHTGAVNSLAFSPDGMTLVSGSDDNTVAVWDIATGRRVTTLEQHTAEVNSVAFSPDGRQLASGSRDKTVILWELAPNASPQR